MVVLAGIKMTISRNCCGTLSISFALQRLGMYDYDPVSIDKISKVCHRGRESAVLLSKMCGF